MIQRNLENIAVISDSWHIEVQNYTRTVNCIFKDCQKNWGDMAWVL